MDKTVLISLSVEDLQSIIVECVNSCLKHQKQESKNPELSEELFTVKQAAEFLNLAVPTIYSKVSKGELPHMKRGKRLYFSSTELMAYLKEGRKMTIAEVQNLAAEYSKNKKRK